jgi:ketosteroid isomerase-like protein
MPEENLDIVRRFGQAFRARDIDSMVEQASEDCVIVSLRSEIEGAFVGRDGVRRWAEGHFDSAPDAEATLERVVAVDDERVLVLGRQRGTVRLGRAPFDGPLAIILEVDAGRLKRLTAFPTHAEALDAAGLSA